MMIEIEFVNVVFRLSIVKSLAFRVVLINPKV